MLCNAADDKVDDGFGQVTVAILVESTVVGPESDKFIDAEEDARDVHSGLHIVLSFNESQNFQAIKGDGVKETSPYPTNCIAVDSVDHTVIVPAADVAM